MAIRRVVLLVLCGLAARVPVGAAAAPRSVDPTTPAAVRIVDNTQRIDINQIGMFVTNTGSIAWDKPSGNAGLEYPRGSGKTAVFAAGLWLGAVVNGQTRVAISEYSDEFGPGSMTGTVADDPNRPEYKVFKLQKSYANSGDAAAALADYNAGAVPHGAPSVTMLGDGTLDIPGDEMLWCVFNDAETYNHTSRAGSTAPLGVEVQLTAFAFSTPGPADRTVFLRYKILDKGTNALHALHMGLWADPDLGGFTDDLVGCDTTRGLGFAYNATNGDAQYGSAPPAVGFDLLRGPIGAQSSPLPMKAFTSYINGTDPDSYVKTYNNLQGLLGDGSTIIDPSTTLPTRYMFSGDPIRATGWVDGSPTDKRMLVSTGPVEMLPGDVQEMAFAIVVGQGPNRLASLQALRCDDDEVQAFFDRNLALPYPASGNCPQFADINCPRTADFWYQQLTSFSPPYSPSQMLDIAQRIDARSLFFDWGANPLASLTAALNPASVVSPATQARREFAAFLCNVAASFPLIVPASGFAAFLEPATPIAFSNVAAQTLQQLAGTATQGLADAAYVDVGPHTTALDGVNRGLPLWNGGAGYAADDLGGTIPSGDPSTHNVEIRFTGGPTGQYAYRYLRTLDSGGSRVYMIQDYVPVPWSIWDLDTHTQLNGAFLENAGPPPSAVQDGQWDPDDSADGGREFLWVMNSAYSGDGTPTPSYFTDPNLQDLLFGALDLRYELAPRRVAPGAVIDAGDIFRFTLGIAAGPGADTRMLQLAALDPGDPATIAGYQDLTGALTSINGGVGIGPTCDGSTPTLVSLVGTDVAPGQVTVTWYASDAASAIRIERREGASEWQDAGAATADGSGLIVYRDAHVTAGVTYGYRLRVGEQPLGETSVVVPLRAVLALEGFRPNPAGRSPHVSFSLADASAATLTVYDVAGRRHFAREVGSLGAGSHLLALPGDLPSGLYVLRLAQGGHTTSRKAMVVR